MRNNNDTISKKKNYIYLQMLTQLQIHTQFTSKGRYTVATKLEDLEDKMKATS